MMHIFSLFFVMFIASIILTGLIRKYAIQQQILDIPNARSSHESPTARGGGMSFVLLFTGLTCVFTYYGKISLSLFYALNGGLLVALIGWLDDVMTIRALWRAGIQTIAAIWAIYWLNGLPTFLVGPIGYIFGIVSIVWATNLYNFMDGIDGLAGSEGVFISMSAAIILHFLGVDNVSLLCFLLAASILGFLVWNWAPAKIFMGDIGSGYLGFIFCVLAFSTANENSLSLLFWCIISSVFLFDATLTVIKRKLQNKCWYEAHKEHAFQYLVGAGASHKKVTTGVVMFNILILFPVACLSLLYPAWNAWIIAIGVTLFFVVWSLIVMKPVVGSTASQAE